MDNKFLHIKDSDNSTDGGPPGWLAFSAIWMSLGLTTLLAFILGVTVF